MNTDQFLQFDGDVKLTGLLASLGQRVLVGVTNTLSKDFFLNMEKELQLQSASWFLIDAPLNRFKCKFI